MSKQREHHEQQEHHEDRERPRRHRDGRDRAMQLKLIERWMAGSAPATPEAYARALEQWHQLSGSVVRPATDLRPDLATPKPGDATPTVPPPPVAAREEEPRP
jgi:hypothetical protein